MVRAVMPECPLTFALGPHDVVLCLGPADGEVVQAVWARCTGEQTLLVCAVAHCLELPIESARVHYFFGPDPALVQHWLLTHAALYLTVRAVLVKDEAAIRAAPAAYARLEAGILEAIRLADVNAITLCSLGRATLHNVLTNLPRLGPLPGVHRLAGLGRGYPAIVLGGGPSLRPQIPDVQVRQQQALVIATDTVAQVCQAADIAPDLLCTLDPQPINAQKLGGWRDAQTPLVLTPHAPPALFTTFPGPLVLSDIGSPLTTFFGAVLPAKGHVLAQAPSVVHLAVNLAVHLGCAEIWLVGVDFCLPETPQGVGPLELSLENVESSRIVYERQPDGRTVATLPTFQTFRDVLRRTLAQHPQVRVFQTSAQALDLGVPVRGLWQGAWRAPSDGPGQGLAKVQWQQVVARVLAAPDPFAPVAFATRRGQLQQMVRQTWRQTRRLTARLDWLTSHQGAARFETTLLQVERAVAQLEADPLLPLLAPHAQHLDLYLAAPEQAAIDRLPAGDERLQRRLERALPYYQGLLEVLETARAALDAPAN